MAAAPALPQVAGWTGSALVSHSSVVMNLGGNLSSNQGPLQLALPFRASPPLPLLLRLDLSRLTGQPGRQSTAGCAAAAPESRELWVTHSHSQLLQGGAPGAGCGARGVAPPAAAWEYLAAPQGAAPPAPAALRLPAGCPAGNTLRPHPGISHRPSRHAWVPHLGDQAWGCLIYGRKRAIQPPAAPTPSYTIQTCSLMLLT